MTDVGLFGPIEGRTLPPYRRRPAFRIVMLAAGHEFYITTCHGPERKAQRYAAKLEARDRYRYEAREVPR
jgi:hypothetical protein